MKNIIEEVFENYEYDDENFIITPHLENIKKLLLEKQGQHETVVIRFAKWWCRSFGHKFMPIDTLMFEIKNNSINHKQDAILICRRCKENFVSKNV